MPKLQSALLAHQAHAARKAEQAKKEQGQRDRHQSQKQGKKKRKHTAPDAAPTTPLGSSGVTGRGHVASLTRDGRCVGSSHGVFSSQHSTANSGPSYRPPTNPFEKTDTILLLGEANFSFAVSLISAPHMHPPHLICATSYDSEDVSPARSRSLAVRTLIEELALMNG